MTQFIKTQLVLNQTTLRAARRIVRLKKKLSTSLPGTPKHHGLSRELALQARQTPKMAEISVDTLWATFHDGIHRPLAALHQPRETIQRDYGRSEQEYLDLVTGELFKRISVWNR